jgi:hypothetical protein
MVTVVLESADNGIIKTIKDTNINGAGTEFESKTVYDFRNDDLHDKKIEFFYELSEDLGVDVGNIHKNNNLTMSTDWGLSYRPFKEEIKVKIDTLKLQLATLEASYNTQKILIMMM